MVVILQETVLLRASHPFLHRSLDFLFLFFVIWLAIQFFPGPFIAVERFGSSLAKRKRLCIFLLPVLAIVLRLSLLWAMPIPYPEVHDEFSYLLAADTFSHGRLTNPPHPLPIYFDTFHVIQQPTYMSIYPPAQGAVLAFGQLLGLPWIGVLLSVAVMLGAVLWALQGWFPSRWALLGAVLVLFHLAISTYWINSYWGGAVAATGGALVFGALPRIMRFSRIRDAVLLGLGTSILANSRPFEGVFFCLPVLAAFALWICRGKAPSWRTATLQIVLPFSVVMFLCVCFMGYYNLRLTGHPSSFAYVLNVRSHFSISQLAWEKTVAPFHFQNPQFEAYYNGWWLDVASARGRPDSLMHVISTLRQDIWVFAVFYAYPELMIAVLALPWLLRDRRMRFPLVQILFCFAGFLLVALFLRHYSAPLTITTYTLIAQGMRHIRQWRIRNYPLGTHLTRAVVVSTVLLSPLRSYHVHPSLWVVHRQEIEAQLKSKPGTDLVIVRYSAHHGPLEEWVYNAADIDHAKIVWAREIPGVSLQPLLTYFHSHNIWFVDADENPPRLSPYVPPANQAPVPANTAHDDP